MSENKHPTSFNYYGLAGSLAVGVPICTYKTHDFGGCVKKTGLTYTVKEIATISYNNYIWPVLKDLQSNFKNYITNFKDSINITFKGWADSSEQAVNSASEFLLDNIADIIEIDKKEIDEVKTELKQNVGSIKEAMVNTVEFITEKTAKKSIKSLEKYFDNVEDNLIDSVSPSSEDSEEESNSKSENKHHTSFNYSGLVENLAIKVPICTYTTNDFIGCVEKTGLTYTVKEIATISYNNYIWPALENLQSNLKNYIVNFKDSINITFKGWADTTEQAINSASEVLLDNVADYIEINKEEFYEVKTQLKQNVGSIKEAMVDTVEYITEKAAKKSIKSLEKYFDNVEDNVVDSLVDNLSVDTFNPLLGNIDKAFELFQ
ncbi:MAG: hypothetical protein K0R02_481 [Rickettsiaceae bacterium]|jgi:hypothetical protein|nr:hypothetical protein [Rickettsiaceae bacterium]